MFAMMPTPIFSFESSLPSSATPLQQPKYRPSVSSPLSSSPIRASSYSPPAPTSPPTQATFSFFPQQSRHEQQQNQHQIPRDTQSSPIAQPSPTRKLFKFATRTPRPNPVVQKREEARESRRKLFLKNVRERTDDKAWERRGGDQEVLRLEWSRLNNELRQQKEAELAVFGTDEDIEDALQLQQESGYSSAQQLQRSETHPAESIDDMMVDAIAREEEAEIEALLSSMQPPPLPLRADEDGDRDMDEGRPGSVYFSDDDDYDALFMELSQQDTAHGFASSQDMEMT